MSKRIEGRGITIPPAIDTKSEAVGYLSRVDLQLARKTFDGLERLITRSLRTGRGASWLSKRDVRIPPEYRDDQVGGVDRFLAVYQQTVVGFDDNGRPITEYKKLS